MKKILIVLLLIIAAAAAAKSQTATADSLAQKISRKMKDTLGLTNDQRVQLYQLNVQLHEAKMSKRQWYTGDSLQIYMQRIEGTRDSLYRQVLTQEQHVLYLQKKNNLINNQ